jgi:hypothetical protein
MPDNPNFIYIDRRHEPHSNKVSAVGFRLNYQDRECDLDIRISPPLAGDIPERKAALDEFQRLREALDHILAEHKP